MAKLTKVAPKAKTFTERFNEATANVNETELALMLGLSVSAVRKLRAGDQQMLKLDSALRLCDRLQMDPWELAFGRPKRSSSGKGDPASGGSAQPHVSPEAYQELLDAIRDLEASARTRDQHIEALRQDLQVSVLERDRRFVALQQEIEHLSRLVEKLELPVDDPSLP